MCDRIRLSPARRQLLEMLLHLGHGRFENVPIRGGDPVLDPRPRIVFVYKTCPGTNRRRYPITVADLARTPEVQSLFGQFDRISDGVIDLIQVQNALPFLVEIAGLPT